MEVYLIYASTSGNVETVMECVSHVLGRHGFETFLCRSEQTNIEVVKKNKKFIFATSTWEHGLLNPFFDKLYEQMQTISCMGKEAAFVGLGDRRYEPVLFCEGMEKVRRLFVKVGGVEVEKALKIQGEPYDLLELTVEPWAVSVSKLLSKHHA